MFTRKPSNGFTGETKVSSTLSFFLFDSKTEGKWVRKWILSMSPLGILSTIQRWRVFFHEKRKKQSPSTLDVNLFPPSSSISCFREESRRESLTQLPSMLIMFTLMLLMQVIVIQIEFLSCIRSALFPAKRVWKTSACVWDTRFPSMKTTRDESSRYDRVVLSLSWSISLFVCYSSYTFFFVSSNEDNNKQFIRRNSEDHGMKIDEECVQTLSCPSLLESSLRERNTEMCNSSLKRGSSVLDPKLCDTLFWS
jgi:hypothetical protein